MLMRNSKKKAAGSFSQSCLPAKLLHLSRLYSGFKSIPGRILLPRSPVIVKNKAIANISTLLCAGRRCSVTLYEELLHRRC